MLHFFSFFTPSPLRRPRASLTAKQAPATYTKTCPAYATPFVPTLLKTASPERLLRPPPSLLPCFNFFLPLQCPLSGGLGQLFVYVAETPPSLPPCFTFFLFLHRPLSEGLGQVSQRSKPRPHIQKLAPLMLPPSYLPSLKPLPRNAFKFFLPLQCPLPGGLGQLFVYVAEAPPSLPFASLFFSFYTVPSQKASGKSHSEASPGHIYKNLPRLCYPLRTYPP